MIVFLHSSSDPSRTRHFIPPVSRKDEIILSFSTTHSNQNDFFLILIMQDAKQAANTNIASKTQCSPRYDSPSQMSPMFECSRKERLVLPPGWERILSRSGSSRHVITSQSQSRSKSPNKRCCNKYFSITAGHVLVELCVPTFVQNVNFPFPETYLIHHPLKHIPLTSLSPYQFSSPPRSSFDLFSSKTCMNICHVFTGFDSSARPSFTDGTMLSLANHPSYNSTFIHKLTMETTCCETSQK